MRPLAGTVLALSALLETSLLAQAGPDNPNRVLVVYRTNSADTDGNGIPDSLDIANLYAQRRGIPANNLFGINCSPGGSSYDYVSGWTTCFGEVITPIRNKLNQLGQTQIDTIVLCHRIPYQFYIPEYVPGDPVRCLDQYLATLWYTATSTNPNLYPYWYPNFYFEASPTVGTDKGRFTHANSLFFGTNSYLVGRLDGPDLLAAKDLVERAWYGDVYVANQPGYYNGNAYVDTRFQVYTDPFLTSGYPFGYNAYADGDKSMAFGKIVCQNHGYTPLWEPYETEIGEPLATFASGGSASVAAQALFYGGWYNYNTYHDGWEWIPGSAAIDLNSNSGAGLWNPSPGNFLPSAFLRGLTAGAGCIAEPYLSGHPRPEVFLHYILSGFTFGEAAMLSDPTARWTSIYVGDPMYNPFRPGKPLVLDQTDPAIGSVACLYGSGGTDRTIQATLADTGVPEVVVMSVDHGTTPALGATVTNGSRFSRRPEVALTGLVPSTLYRYVVTVKDPVLRQASTTTFVTYTENPAPSLCRAVPSVQSVPASAPFGVSFVHARANPADPITLVTLLADIPALGVSGLDITAALPVLVSEVLTSPDGREIMATVTVPPVLPAGSVTLILNVTTPMGTTSSTASVTLLP